MGNQPIVELVRKSCPGLSVGAVSANLMAIAQDISCLEQNGVPLLHFDVMDGHFVPQLTVGPSFVKGIKTSMFKDVHLMISDPYASLPQYAAAGADILSVHVESCIHAKACLQLIGTFRNANDPSRGILRGIAVCPGTAICDLRPLLDETDMVTIVAINPGFPGQKIDANTAQRVEAVRRVVTDTGRDILLCIDGGITKDTIAQVWAMKPDIVVSGSAIFEHNAIGKNVQIMMSNL